MENIKNLRFLNSTQNKSLSRVLHWANGFNTHFVQSTTESIHLSLYMGLRFGNCWKHTQIGKDTEV